MHSRAFGRVKPLKIIEKPLAGGGVRRLRAGERAVKFKKERGRLPAINSQDAWERRMAEGAAAFVRFKDEGRYE